MKYRDTGVSKKLPVEYYEHYSYSISREEFHVLVQRSLQFSEKKYKRYTYKFLNQKSKISVVKLTEINWNFCVLKILQREIEIFEYEVVCNACLRSNCIILGVSRIFW